MIEVKRLEPFETVKWRISRECHVVLALRGVVTQEAITKLIHLLQAMKDCYPIPDAAEQPDRDHPPRDEGDARPDRGEAGSEGKECKT